MRRDTDNSGDDLFDLRPWISDSRFNVKPAFLIAAMIDARRIDVPIGGEGRCIYSAKDHRVYSLNMFKSGSALSSTKKRGCCVAFIRHLHRRCAGSSCPK
jgi:hypothetical protein